MAKHGKPVITVIGAAGTMGTIIANNLMKKGYNMLFCEKGKGISKLHGRGLRNSGMKDAVPKSELIIMVVPDSRIAEVSKNVVPLMKTNATLVLLDPGAAYAGEVALRDDCTFVIVHPCHPPLFGEQGTPEARKDFFGGVGKMDLVIAMLRGNEETLEEAERVSVEMFAPIGKCHRITVEQMVILEPIASEVVAGPAAMLMREALDEAVKHGVPEEAAKALMLGHIQIELAIFFGECSHQISESARIALKYGCDRILRSDWRELFKSKAMKDVIQKTLHPKIKAVK